MAKVTVKMTPNNVLNPLRREAAKAYYKMGVLVMTAAKASMKQGKSVGPLGGVVHTPSKAGTPPNTQTTDLQRSIARAHFVVNGEPVCIVGPTVKIYGAAQEFGTPDLPPRPFMRPALRRKAREFPELMRGILK